MKDAVGRIAASIRGSQTLRLLAIGFRFGVRMHPIQYLLLGGALCMSYLLELSLAEHAVGTRPVPAEQEEQEQRRA